MGAGQATGGGLQIPGAAVTAGVRAEDTLSALDKLSQAYKDGIVGVNDLMTLFGKGAAMPAQVNQARDASDAAKANMRVRPLETADRIGDLEAKAQLRPKVTALKSDEIDTARKNLLFGESTRADREALERAKLDDAQFQADLAKALRGDVATTAKAKASADATRAVGEANLAPGEVEIEAETLRQALTDPNKTRAFLIDALNKLGVVDYDQRNDPIDVLADKFRKAATEAKRTELDLKREQEAPQKAESLRKEIASNDSLKDYRATATALSVLEATLSGDKPSGPKDIAAVYQFIKVLDPNSVVKEGEVTLVRSAVPGMDQLGLLVDKFKSGAALTPETRQQYLEVARELAAAKAGPAQGALQPYLESAMRDGIPLERVFTPAERALLATQQKRTSGPGGSPAPTKPSEAAGLPPGTQLRTTKDGRKVIVRPRPDGNFEVVGPVE